MLELKIEADYQQALRATKQALANVKNLTPVLNRFAVEYGEIIESNWGTVGKIMQGSRWAKRKGKKSGRRLLVLSGDMKKGAVTPKAKQVQRKLILTWDLPFYWKFHQYGTKNMPQRAFLWTSEGRLPKQALRILLDLTNRHLERGVN